MSLADIPAKRLPTQTPASSAIKDVLDAIYNAGRSGTYFDGTARTPGSGIAHNVQRQQSGGNTVAVYSEMPGLSDVCWIIAGDSAGTACTMASPDSQAASRLLYQVTKGADVSAYNTWTANPPITGATAFGYWRSVSCGSTTVGKVHPFETAETWRVVLEDSGGGFYDLEAGAWIDPLTASSLSAESSGRLVGQRGTGATAIASNFATAAAAANALLHHATTDGQAHQGVFQPSTGTIWPLNLHLQPDVSNTSAMLNSDGEFVRIRPVFRRNAAASNDRFVGQDRTLSFFRDAKAMQKETNVPGATVAFILAGSLVTDQDAMAITGSGGA